MKLKTKFNLLTIKEYFYYIENHKRYSNFNTLGLYRSIIENRKLKLEDRIIVRNFANSYFLKSFEFLQIKDPNIYFELITLGQELTRGDEVQIWKTIKINQQKILSTKKIKHRNFGVYSKHLVSDYDSVPLLTIMHKQKFPSSLAPTLGCFMEFNNDKRWPGNSFKSENLRRFRKNKRQEILKLLDDE